MDSEVALGVIATVKGGAPVENLRVAWRIASGTGVLVSPSGGPVVTRTNSNGLTSVNFRPSAPDWTSITAAIDAFDGKTYAGKQSRAGDQRGLGSRSRGDRDR